MAKPLTILISSAGRRVELINCFLDAARGLDCELRVIATDARPAWSAACQHADKSFTVPRCDDPGFLLATLEICQREKVGLILPTIDPELVGFAGFRAQFEAVGTSVAVSSPEVVAMARNKLDSNRFLCRIGVGAPRTETLRTALQDVMRDPNSWRFPLIAKPIDGSASVGLQRVPSPDALRALAVNADRYVVQDRVQGQEYTVNLFFDRSGLRCATHHRRVEMRGGEVSKGLTERIPALATAAEKVGEALATKAYGVVNFQAIIPPHGDPQVLEINARMSGGYPLVHRAGANFAKWLLEPVLGLPGTANNQWKDGIAMLRYDAAYFSSPGPL